MMWYARSPAVTGSDSVHAVTFVRVAPGLIMVGGVVARLASGVRAIVATLRGGAKEG